MITRVSLTIFALSFVLNCDLIEAFCPRAANLNGIIVPVPTPYKDCTRQVDYDKVDQMAEYYASKGIRIILVAGRSGEGYLLSEAECRLLYARWLAAGKRCGLVIVVSVGEPTQVGIRLAQYADSIGVAAITVLLPVYFKPMNTKEAFNAMQLFACLKTAIILYLDPMSLPKCLRVDELYQLLSEKMSNFCGVRISLEQALQIRAAGLYNPNQIIWISNQYSIQPTFYLGFNGSVSVANALAPEFALAIQKADCEAEARFYQEKINKLIRDIASPRNYLASTKVAISIVSGIDAGSVRPPIPPTTCEERKSISSCLQNTPGLVVRSPVRSCNECNYFYDSITSDSNESEECE